MSPGPASGRTDTPAASLLRRGEGRAVEVDVPRSCSDQPQQYAVAHRLRALGVDVVGAERVDELEAEPSVRERLEVHGKHREAAHAAGTGVADVDVAAGFGGESHAESVPALRTPGQGAAGPSRWGHERAVQPLRAGDGTGGNSWLAAYDIELAL